MKIAILTQPLNTNYGGLLQAYAMQKSLSKLGHNATTINRVFPPKKTLNKIESFIKRILLKYIKRRKDIEVFPLQPSKKEKEIMAKYTSAFIKNNIALTKTISSSTELKGMIKDYDAFVVGSDQVWRPKYSPSIYNYFFDFVANKNSKKVKLLSYAASFGVDSWEFNAKETKECSTLIKNFDAVSVREDSGVSLCKTYLGATATHVLDPTLLLSKEDYLNIISKQKLVSKGKILMAYVLDTSVEKIAQLKEIAKQLNVKLIYVEPDTGFTEERRNNIDQYILPTVGKWLSDFLNAEYVITDSFHGTVFSIIFNKKFIAIGNKKRGISRFTSILNLLGLTDRMVNSLEEVRIDKLTTSIDYAQVNESLENEKKKSINFLTNNLK